MKTQNQTRKLDDWAASVDGDGRVWAVEAATGLGHILSQQFVACGEPVLDVPVAPEPDPNLHAHAEPTPAATRYPTASTPHSAVNTHPPMGADVCGRCAYG